MRSFITRLRICFIILFKCRHERVGQFITNRLQNENLFYLSDVGLAWRLNKTPKKETQE
jgi:hypothetical protein